MKVAELMSQDLACCSPETPLTDVARMMAEHDCGAIPVVESRGTQQILRGIVTDRDIVCRTIAQGINPLEATAAECMTTPCHTVNLGDEVDELCHTMEEHQIRRVPVLDDSGNCCGIVAQADVARRASEDETAEVVKQISQPCPGTTA